MFMKKRSTAATTLAAAALAVLILNVASANAALIHHWELDGDATDSVGSDNGTATGSPTYVTGKFGQAVSLDGSTQYITTGTDPFPSTNFTLTAWLKQSTADTRWWAIGTQANPDGIHLWQTASLLRARILGGGNPEVADDAALALNEWVHVAVTVSSTAGMELFVNGVSQGTNAAGTSQSSEANFTIGKRPDAASDHFPGLIDDVAIFDHLLTSTQLSNVINQGAADFDAVVVPAPAALPAGLTMLGLVAMRRRMK